LPHLPDASERRRKVLLSASGTSRAYTRGMKLSLTPVSVLSYKVGESAKLAKARETDPMWAAIEATLARVVQAKAA
jgi:hypothetical protein